jgi:hypothetical protein
MRESPRATLPRLSKLFQSVLNREPRGEELSRLTAFYAEQKARVISSGRVALDVLGHAGDALSEPDQIEAATITALARVLMNLDEFINRE